MSLENQEMLYEQKLDQISEHLEELLLDAFLSVLHKLKQRENLFLNVIERQLSDDMKF